MIEQERGKKPTTSEKAPHLHAHIHITDLGAQLERQKLLRERSKPSTGHQIPTWKIPWAPLIWVPALYFLLKGNEGSPWYPREAEAQVLEAKS